MNQAGAPECQGNEGIGFQRKTLRPLERSSGQNSKGQSGREASWSSIPSACAGLLRLSSRADLTPLVAEYREHIRESAEPEGRQSMGGVLQKPRPLHHAALLPPGYRLQAWICLQLLNWKGLEGSSAHSKFLLEPRSHLLSAASQSCDNALSVTWNR